MAGTVWYGRWMRRLLLLAAAVCGLWLLGLLSHAGQAQAATRAGLEQPGLTRTESVARAGDRVDATLNSAVTATALVGKTVAPTVAPVGSAVRTILAPGSAATAPAPATGRLASRSTGSAAGSSTGSPAAGRAAGHQPAPAVNPVRLGLIAPTVSGAKQDLDDIAAPVLTVLVAPVAQVVTPVLDPILVTVLQPLPRPVVGVLPPVANPSPTGLVLPATRADLRPSVATAPGRTFLPTIAAEPTLSVQGPSWTARRPVPPQPGSNRPVSGRVSVLVPRPVPGSIPPSALGVASGTAAAAQSAPALDAVPASSSAQPVHRGPRSILCHFLAPREQAFSPAVSPD